MIIIAKQKNENSKLYVKEFENGVEAAFYLKVHPSTVYKAMGRYEHTPFKVKGWYVDQD